jgi:primosomal protein N' (replication factor Y)
VEQFILKIALDSPLDRLFDYRYLTEDGVWPQIGQVVQVPFGRQELAGLIIDISDKTDIAADKLKDVLAVRHQCPPVSAQWLDLCRFAADYYQRNLGEVVIPALPKNLRAGKSTALDKQIKKLEKAETDGKFSVQGDPELNAEQQHAVARITVGQKFSPFLLYGVTGSGKTEVYLQAIARILQRDAQAQVLILVPEINLTPQLEQHLRQRYDGVCMAVQHSGMAEGERLKNWLAAHLGKARIILGTRLAILMSMPHLKLIVIDEEHDPSYKQQEGLRYSARDLAIWRARQLDIPVVLGSATPSLESWQHAQSGRYTRLDLRQRAVHSASLPSVKLIDLAKQKAQHGITQELISAITRRLQKGEQSLLFLNRRGYAPVIACDACGWISNCQRCSAYLVMHKLDHRLRCHHCGFEQIIPKHCPDCGNIDLQAMGRGTQRVEENLGLVFPEARIFRIDADSTRKKGSAEAAFAAVHSGEVDILVGTQMVAKGHDFKNLSLVGILNPDTALFSQDYRASERLFAQLMQVSGRAGRQGQKLDGNPPEVLIQTRYADHPLYRCLLRHDYDSFANSLLDERQQAQMPPFMYQALLRAEARELQIALDFLQHARQLLDYPGVTLNQPIPMTMMRIANYERAQLLLESPSRPALLAFLRQWLSLLRTQKSRVRWLLEIDPVDI